MLGTTEIRLSVPIYNEVSSLPLIGDSVPVLLSVGGMYVCVLLRCSDRLTITRASKYTIGSQ